MGLVEKFLAMSPEQRAHRLSQVVRSRIIHNALLALKRLHYGDFYLQARPTNEVIGRSLVGVRALNQEWTAASLRLGMDLSRVYNFYLNISALDERRIEGAFAEVGVYKGHTARILHRLAADRTLYLFDTFEGFTTSDLAAEEEVLGKLGPTHHDSFSDTSVEAVRNLLGDPPNVRFCQGRFPETTTGVASAERFALVHYDADLYQPAKAACEYFYPRMSPGGLMIFHNYADDDFPGTKKAVDEFFEDKPEDVVAIPDQGGTAVVRVNKRKANS